ncbi:Unannotated [Lentimonas sp. CC11]|nr:Unannotated [Lentimonas sp. CC11]
MQETEKRSIICKNNINQSTSTPQDEAEPELVPPEWVQRKITRCCVAIISSKLSSTEPISTNYERCK